MNARRLLRWADLDDRRRRAERGLLGRLSPWLVAGGGALLFAAEIARRLGGFGEAAAAGATRPGAFRLWLAVTLAVHVLVLFGSPHRLFWRHDSALLARLPVRGGALFRLALLRSMRAAARAALPCATSALAFALALGWTTALRLELLVAICAAGAGLLGPAAALAAGAVVASDRAQAMLGELSGEFRAPRTAWLGVLPGLAGTALVIAVVVLAPWAGGAPDPRGVALAAAFLAVPLLSAVWALCSADRIMTAAVREVSALDEERLAHIERKAASPLERGWARLVALDRVARLVYQKDAALARRRYPSPYFIGPLGVIVLWGMAAFGGSGALSWAAVVLFGLGAYAALMARRITHAPVEIPRLVASLPIGANRAHAAKRAQVALRAITWVVLGGAPLAFTQPEPWTAWAVVGAALAMALGGGIAALRA